MPPRPNQSITVNSATAKPETDWLRLFETLGLEFHVNGSVQVVADCPWCGKPKFYLNRTTSQYDCKVCGEKGNRFGFLRRFYADALEATTDEQYQELKRLRGLPLQTLKRHGFAFDRAGGCWLIPFKSRHGLVLNIVRYWPPRGTAKSRKQNLPTLETQFYGLDQLSADAGRLLFLCEGPFDAMALDHHLREKKTRERYDILAVPGATIFKPTWANLLRDRKVRIVFDNDDAGRKGQQRVVKVCREANIPCELSLFQWPDGFPAGTDINDLVKEDICLVKLTQEHCRKAAAESRLRLLSYADVKDQPDEMRWLWKDRIPLASYVTFMGHRGSCKSTIAADLVARVTTGRAMPDGRPGIGPAHVIYLTSEDEPKRVYAKVKLAGGDVERLSVVPIMLNETEQVNMLQHLDELESLILERQTKLIVVDAQNSFVGTPDITTDMKGRANVSNRLHAFAQRTGVCLIGIRNTSEEGGRALGSQSMSDIARCIFSTVELSTKKGEPRRFQLVFDKVNDAAKERHPPIPFGIKNLGDWRRLILWGKDESPPVSAAKKVAKKGSARARLDTALRRAAQRKTP